MAMTNLTLHNFVIDELGGTSATARLFRVTPEAVSQWRKNGIPDYRIDYLQLLRPDIFKKFKNTPATSIGQFAAAA